MLSSLTSRSPARILLLPAMLLIALLACGLWPSGGAGDMASCDDVQLAEQHGRPGDTIEVTGVPQSMTGLYVDVSTDDNGSPTVSPMLLTPDGGLAVLVPMHPDGLAGGQLTMVITNGDRDCPAVTLQVDPIEPAPAGTLEAYVAAVGQNLANWREDVGVSREHLLTGHLEPEFVPLAAAQILYDGPDNPTSLVRIADGTAEFPSGGKVDPEIVNTMLYYSGLPQELDDLKPPEDELAAGTGRGRLAAPTTQQGAATQLSRDMTRQATCLGLLTGKSGDVLNDIDLAITATGVINAPTGIFLAAAKLVALWPMQYCAYRLPSEFTGMNVDLSHEHFLEDFDFDTEFPVVRSVQVTARSESWNLTPIVIDTLLLVGGAADEAAKLGKVAPEAGAVSDINAALAPATNNACGRSDCADDIGVTLPPLQFGPIDINWPQFVRFTGLRSITTGDFGLYRPAATGPGGLRVETLPVFGDASTRQTFEMNVDAIDVSLSPRSVTVKPGESVPFTVTISNAEHPELNDWTELAPGGGEQLVAQNSDSYTFQAPAKITHDADPDPCKEQEIWGILVEATTSTGLRKDRNPPRSASAVITVEKDVSQENQAECGTPTPTPTPKPDECLIGSWDVVPASYDAYLQALLGGGDIESIEHNGVLSLTFMRDWSLTIDMDMALTFCSSQGCITTNVVQSGSGTYSINPSAGTISSTGVPVVASIGDVSESVGPESGSGSYTCDGDTLTITPAGAPGLEYERR